MSTRTFRPGRTIVALILWTLIVGVTAFLIEQYALDLPRGSQERWIAQLAFAACVMLGPAALVAHLVRCWVVRVTVDSERGLILSRGTQIPWEAIRNVEYRSAPFLGGRTLRSLDGGGDDDVWGCLWMGSGCADGGIAALALIALLVLLSCVILPVFFLFSPWHNRVIIRLVDDRRIVYRDLKDDDEFVNLVEHYLERRHQ
ncbi:MAG: hypothetical protein ACYTAF_16650 [Planctomycetota bacterium]|jgi:hypothetical protein